MLSFNSLRAQAGQLLRGAHAAQFTAASTGALVRVFALGSQFIVFLILARMMTQDVFGQVMVAFAAHRLIGTALGTGAGSLIIYHGSRNQDDDIQIRRFHLSVVSIAVGAAVVVLCLTLPLVGIYLNGHGRAELYVWLVKMAPLAPLSAGLTVSASALDARSQVTRAILLAELVPNIARAAMLALGWLLGLGLTAVPLALWGATMLAWLPILYMMWPRPFGLGAVRKWDAKYAGKLTLHTLLSTQLQGIDMLIAGAMFAPRLVGSYAVAVRLAVLLPFFQALLTRQFAPRAGAMFGRSDFVALQSATDQLRVFSVASTLIILGAIVTLLPIIPTLLGGFYDAGGLFALLAIPAIIRCCFAGGERLLVVGGKASIALGVMLTSFLIVLVFPLMAGHLVGLRALPLAMLISALILNPITAVAVWKAYRIKVARLWDVAVAGLALLALSPLLLGMRSPGTLIVCGIALALLGGVNMSLELRLARVRARTNAQPLVATQ
jgi:O-antigen/teichoic acid export membrane protein